MNLEQIERNLISSMGSLDEKTARDCILQLISAGYGRHKILDLLDQGMTIVGRLFETGEYFIGDLIVSGVTYMELLELLPVGDQKNRIHRGKVLIGVVEHDIHDIGKNIVCSLLNSEGFDIIDLGTDVPVESFIKAAQEFQPDVIALSGVLSYSSIEMGETIKRLREAGLPDGCKVIIGGACTNAALCDICNADAYTKSPLETLQFCEKQVEKDA